MRPAVRAMRRRGVGWGVARDSSGVAGAFDCSQVRKGDRGRQHHFEEGRCCLGFIPVILVVAAAVALFVLVLTPPSEGALPLGPSHGSTPALIGETLALEAAVGLATSPHATVTLSEQDLSVIAAAQNPDPESFHNVEARVRNGQLVITANTTMGPWSPTVTTWVTLAAEGVGTPQVSISDTVTSVQLGHITLPSWARLSIDPRGNAVIDLDSFIAQNLHAPRILGELAVSNIDCIALEPGGLVISVHRPGVKADPSLCQAAP